MKVAARCDRAESWPTLKTLFDESGAAFDLRRAFASDPNQFETLSFEAPD